MAWVERYALAALVTGLGFLLLAPFDNKVAGTVLVGIGTFLIPSVSFRAGRGQENSRDD